MYSDLPKIWDRDFVAGYLLPVGLFLFVTYAIVTRFDVGVIARLERDRLLGAVVAGLLTLGLSVSLLVLNRDIWRTLAGHGRVNPARLLARIERDNFQRLYNAIDHLDEAYRNHQDRNEAFPAHLAKRRDRLWRHAAIRFPDRSTYLLPTAFGNTIRAFEVYPRVMYGLDDVSGWLRLSALVPQPYLKRIDAAKALVDFWVNAWFLSIVVLIEYLVLVALSGHFLMPLLPLVTVLVIFGTAWRARYEAVEWGELVKAAYDIYLPQLYTQLGVEPPATRAEERELWATFSNAIVYRSPGTLPPRRPDEESNS